MTSGPDPALDGAFVPLDAARLSAAAGPAIDAEAVDRIGSTNAALMQRPFGAAPARPRVLAAALQTAGRGRRGRSWLATGATSLPVSVALERPAGAGDGLAGWPIAAGVAIAGALAAQVPDLRLKWPNDLQRDGRKCGGILIETRRRPAGPEGPALERAVVGTGLNLLTDAALRAAIDQPVCGLFDALDADRAVAADACRPTMSASAVARERERLAGDLARALAQAWAQFAREGLAPFAARWRALDALAGQPVRVIDEGAVLFEGTADGIDAGGALRVVGPSGVRSVVVGDVSVRRAGGPR